MSQRNKDDTSHNQVDGLADDAELVIDMPESERSNRLKELDAEISMLERAHMGADDNPDLPGLSDSEQHNLNWMLSWENFDRMVEKRIQQLAEQIHLENEALTNFALEKLYRFCDDNDRADIYLADAHFIIKTYATEKFDNKLNWKTKNPFQESKLTELFEQEWKSLANGPEPD
ncbi:MAG: hypothetical protein JKY67_06660 [Pseudomonadales bacterium]|nr:hypothetical protein [Pseudomonadales bacterium]